MSWGQIGTEDISLEVPEKVSRAAVLEARSRNPGMQALPPDLQVLVCSHLSSNELDQLSLVSSDSRVMVDKLLKNDAYWHQRLEHLIGCSVGIYPGLSYRHIYACAESTCLVESNYGSYIDFGRPMLVKKLRSYAPIATYTELIDSCHADFDTACEYQRCDVLRLLLGQESIDPAELAVQLRRACINGRVKTVKILLGDGRADPNQCLRRACSRIDIRRERGEIPEAKLRCEAEVVRLLLADPRVDVDLRCVDSARRTRNDGVLEVLLKDERIKALLAKQA